MGPATAQTWYKMGLRTIQDAINDPTVQATKDLRVVYGEADVNAFRCLTRNYIINYSIFPQVMGLQLFLHQRLWRLGNFI